MFDRLKQGVLAYANGYPCKGMQYDTVILNDRFDDKRAARERIGVRAKFSILLSVIVLVLNLKVSTEPYAQYLMILISSVVLFWFGAGVFVSAVRSVLKFRFNFDLIAAVSALSAYVFGCFTVLYPSFLIRRAIPVDLYFGEACTMISFMILGRWIEISSVKFTNSGKSDREIFESAESKVQTLIKEAFRRRVPASVTVARITRYYGFLLVLILLFSASVWYALSRGAIISQSVLAVTLILILASPCLHGLVIPFAVKASVKNLSRKKIYVKESRCVQLVLEVSAIVIDLDVLEKIQDKHYLNACIKSLKDSHKKIYLLSRNVDADVQQAALSYGIDYCMQSAETQEIYSFIRQLQSQGNVVAFAGSDEALFAAIARADIGLVSLDDSQLMKACANVVAQGFVLDVFSELNEVCDHCRKLLVYDVVGILLTVIVGMTFASGAAFAVSGSRLTPLIAAFLMMVQFLFIGISYYRMLNYRKR